MTSNLFYMSLALSVFYLLIAIFFFVFFFTGRKYIFTLTRVLIFLNLSLHIVFLVLEGIRDGRIPVTSVFEAMSVTALLLTLLYLIIPSGLKAESIGVFIFPLIFTFQALSAVGSRVVYLDKDLFKTPIFSFHTITTIIGYAAFVYSMILGIMYLHLFHELKIKKLRWMYDRLPPLELLEKMNNVSMNTGFIFLTLGILSGMVLARSAWGTIPFLDPKIFLSVILWLTYLFGILMRRFFKWIGKKLSYVSVFGFVIMVFTFFFVKMVFSTMHNF